MGEARILKPLEFVGSSRENLQEFPDDVKQDIGYALFEAQQGRKSSAAKPLKGFGGAGVLEVAERFDGATYRAVYTVQFAKTVYVLHCFQKKSKSGIKTPQQEIGLIKRRLKAAEEAYQATYGRGA